MFIGDIFDYIVMIYELQKERRNNGRALFIHRRQTFKGWVIHGWSWTPKFVATVSAVDQASPVLQKIAALCKNLSKSLNTSGGGLTEHLDNANAAAAQHVRAIGAMERAYKGAFAAAKQFASNVSTLAAPAVIHASERRWRPAPSDSWSFRNLPYRA